ncbi:hypothetical protein [Isachenkonia alkalipeptolytica]|uniref:Uncharacterized protein n=1 Tax=Isachenkonia alkalipeptolytica TaxID=2565777 RepID=A0AA43XIG8_9CLOT|nr:hypothetical protein [Isachenkonia alkalipeptolytica]NBG86901.1 hypothetical protein [Isachenkonia alkalipeptolytica]
MVESWMLFNFALALLLCLLINGMVVRPEVDIRAYLNLEYTITEQENSYYEGDSKYFHELELNNGTKWCRVNWFSKTLRWMSGLFEEERFALCRVTTGCLFITINRQ